MNARLFLASLVTLVLLGASGPVSAQLVLDSAAIPSGSPDNQSTTEQVDFADVDLDGDWDVAMADGGDHGNDQNRIWINQGGLQGGVTGVFADETTTRFPTISDQSRDVEFADYDGDGDPDLYIANSATITNQSSRFWTNLGLAQGGAIGTYDDETAARFVGLGAAGSSVPAAYVLPWGGFIDSSHDGEFADLDNDGDLDLVHISIGSVLSGNTPTRLFLNDGAGFFTEHNPSGFMLSSSTILEGSPALWAEGVQASNTFDTTGAEADIAVGAEDGDVADIDGDFDLDLVLGDKNYSARVFANRSEGSALAPALGSPLFRDVTYLSFTPGFSSNHGYEQELGDLDGDGDLDLMAVNWGVGGSGYQDSVFANDGAGHFAQTFVLANSGSDDSEADFLDFDGDGDLDAYFANWGNDRLYRNDTVGGVIAFTEEPIPPVGAISLDADAADLDGDGDPDVLVAQEVVKPNVYLRNDYDVPDLHGPVIPALESVSTPTAFPGVLPVRAHVLDNAAYYVTWYADVALEVTVDGAALPPFAMKSSGGQVFRGELPGNLVGNVSYRVVAADEHGNAGASTTSGFTATGDAGASFGAASSGGTTGLVSLAETHAGMTSYLRATATPGSAVFVGAAASALPSPLALPGLPNLVLNLAPPVALIATGTANASGDFVVGGPIPAASAGATLYLQAVSFDGATFESSLGLALLVLP